MLFLPFLVSIPVAVFWTATRMETTLTIYHTLKTIVTHIFHALKLKEREHPKGRKPKLTNIEAATCAIVKQKQNIVTKKSLWEILEPSLSYQKFMDAINRVAPYLARIIAALLLFAQRNPRLIKLTDWTDIPVCLNKN